MYEHVMYSSTSAGTAETSSVTTAWLSSRTPRNPQVSVAPASGVFSTRKPLRALLKTANGKLVQPLIWCIGVVLY